MEAKNEGEENSSAVLRNTGRHGGKRKDSARAVISVLGTVINETLEQGTQVSEEEESLGRKQSTQF